MARSVQPWREAGPPAPMLASPAELDAIALDDSSLLYEQKFDGIRAIVVVEPARPSARIQLLSRNGRDKSAQFPEIVRALREFAGSLSAPVILDGEIVALDAQGRPTTFSALQGRMHLRGAADIAARSTTIPTALIVFDVLRDGVEDLRPLPLTSRRAHLEHLLHVRTNERLREGAYVAGDGQHVLKLAQRENWEGLIVKHADSPYLSGVRSRTWRKVKLHQTATLAIGGWTEPKGTRSGFGALMVGRRDGDALRYAGNVGTGFNGPTIDDIVARLRPLARKTSPFADAPRVRGQHWVEPELRCEVRFSEWTPDGRLRHPVFLGLRDDVEADAVEPPAREETKAPRRLTRASRKSTVDLTPRDAQDVVDQLRALEDAGRDGTVTLPDESGAESIDVTNLRKVFWPALGLTKGDLLRFYAQFSPWLLPIVRDRPLVMKRYPNGVVGKSFYQQRAPETVPPGVRVEVIEDDDEALPRLVGGSLATLLHVAQLGAISFDPWFSTVEAPSYATFAAIDLDPMPGVPFSQVRDVARWVHEALVMLGIPAALKTSGSSGLHIDIPLPEGTTYETAQLLCHIVARAVATQHPRQATVERTVARRGRTVYVDYLQNIEGKTLACAYSVRASTFAGVSTPLRWEELDEDFRPEDFTLQTAPARFAETGDLWNPVMEGPPVDLQAVLDKLGSAG